MIFVRSSKISLFFPELCPFRRVFLFPALLKNLAPNVQALALVSMMSWRSFWKLRSVTGHVFATSDYDHEYFLRISLLFSKADPMLLAWQLWRCPGWAKHFGDDTLKTRMKLDLPALARSSAEGPSIVVAIGTSRVLWSMVQKRKKHKEVSLWLYKGSTLHHLQTSEFWGACLTFPRPDAATVFALRCFRGRGCTAARRSGCSAGKAKKSSHPWHFRCWSLTRNELECTDLVYWTGALHRFSSRDAIIVVGSVLEKHFDGDFTQDQEKEITFKLATGVPKAENLAWHSTG